MNDGPGGGGNVRMSEMTYTYDAMNRMVRDDTSHFNSQTQAPIGDGLRTTTTVYSANSQILSVTNDNGHATASVYDTANRRSADVDALGNVTITSYDAASNVVQTTSVDRSDLGNPNQSFTTTYVYDGLNRRTQIVDNVGSVTRYDYDSRGNVVRTTDALGRETRSAYDGLNRMTRTTRDMDGNGASTADPADITTRSTYDDNSRLTSQIDDNGNGTRCDYTYDGVTGVPNPPGDFGVRHVIRTRHTRISDSSVIDDRTYTWDRVGNKTQRKDIRAGGPRLTHDYFYDASDRLVRTIVTDPTPAVVRDEVYNLDGVGNRATVTGGDNPGPYTLDPTTPEPADFQLNQYTATPFDVRAYDRNGNLITINPGGPAQKTIVYDYRNRMVTYFDAGSGQLHLYSYDALGRRTRKIVDATGAAGGPHETRFFLTGWQEIEEQDGTGATVATYVYGNYIDEVLNMRR